MHVRMLIADLSDSELLFQIQGVVGSRNRATAQLLEYLGEVEARKLHIKEAYASMYDFCLRKLGFSEGSAVRHIAAARACRRFPAALEFVRDGRVHLTGLALLKPQLTDDNQLELLTAAAGRSRAEIELLLRTRRPRPDVPESIRPVFAFAAERDACIGSANRSDMGDAARAGLGDAAHAVGARGSDGLGAGGAGDAAHAVGARGSDGLGPGGKCGAVREEASGLAWGMNGAGANSTQGAARGANSAHGAATGSAPASMTHAERGRVAPLSAERFHVEFTMTADTKDKLERVLDLMSHANPRRSLATAFDRALDVLLRDLEKKRLGKTSRPRKSRGVKHGNIGRSTLREVYERDGVQCAFVSEAGVRCTSRVFLQTDHVIARALGGSGDAHNARVLCQPHNLFEAEETFGAEHVARKIEERRQRARSCRVGARARGGEIDESGNHRRQERLGAASVSASCASRDAGSVQLEGSLTQAASGESGITVARRGWTPVREIRCARGAATTQIAPTTAFCAAQGAKAEP